MAKAKVKKSWTVYLEVHQKGGLDTQKYKIAIFYAAGDANIAIRALNEAAPTNYEYYKK